MTEHRKGFSDPSHRVEAARRGRRLLGTTPQRQPVATCPREPLLLDVPGWRGTFCGVTGRALIRNHFAAVAANSAALTALLGALPANAGTLAFAPAAGGGFVAAEDFDTFTGQGLASFNREGALDSNTFAIDLKTGDDLGASVDDAFRVDIAEGLWASGTISLDDTGGFQNNSGLYSLDRGGGDRALWIQTGSNVFAPTGSLYVRVPNSTDQTLDNLTVAFEFLQPGKSSTFEVDVHYAVATTTSTFGLDPATDVGAYTQITSIADLRDEADFLARDVSAILSGASVSAAESLFLRFTYTTNAPFSLEPIGIDNLTVTSGMAIPEPIAGLAGLGGLALIAARRQRIG